MNYIVQKIRQNNKKYSFFPSWFLVDLSQQKRQEGFYYEEKTCIVTGLYHALGLTACGGSKPAAAPETTAAATEAAAESSEESKADEKTEAAGGDMDALIEAA